MYCWCVYFAVACVCMTARVINDKCRSYWNWYQLNENHALDVHTDTTWKTITRHFNLTSSLILRHVNAIMRLRDDSKILQSNHKLYWYDYTNHSISNNFVRFEYRLWKMAWLILLRNWFCLLIFFTWKSGVNCSFLTVEIMLTNYVQNFV